MSKEGYDGAPSQIPAQGHAQHPADHFSGNIMNFERPKFNARQENRLEALKAFKKKCGYIFKGSLVNISEEQKCILVQDWLGPEGQKIYDSLDWGEGEEVNNYELMWTKLEAAKLPKVNRSLAEKLMVAKKDTKKKTVNEPEGRPSEEESSSSEDEREWREELKKQRKEARNNEERPVLSKPKFYELKSGENFTTVKSAKSTAALKEKKVSLGKRLQLEENSGMVRPTGSMSCEKEITFQVKKSYKEMQRNEEVRAHVEERRKLHRSARSILSKEKRAPVFWRGKRVR